MLDEIREVMVIQLEIDYVPCIDTISHKGGGGIRPSSDTMTS